MRYALGALSRPKAASRISHIVPLILILCFALQVFSPLRLNTDAVSYLSMAESAAEGHGFLQNGLKTVFPPGYPALLAVLLKAGLGHSWAIIGLNVILLAAGTIGAYRVLVQELFKDKALALHLCSLSLLSFVVIKHLTFAMSDVAFFCGAMCCVAVISHASVVPWGRQFAVVLAASWLLVVGSIAIRRIGIALIPAFVFVAISRPEMKTLLRECSVRAKVIIGAAIAGGFIGTIWVIANTSTLSDFSKATSKSSMFETVPKIVSWRLMELGELLINVSLSKLPRIVHGIVPRMGIILLLLMLFGLVLLSLILGGLFRTVRKRKKIGPAELFLVSYMVVLFAWPYADARLWLPVIPLLVGYSDASIKWAIKLGLPKALIAVYISAFVILGVGSIGYSTRITFAGSKFPDLYVDGALRPIYCAAFQTCSGTVDKGEVNPEILHLLQTYR
jgi:hypothetical protein